MGRTVEDLNRIRRECKRIVARRSFLSAGAAAVPIPGVDLAADLKILHDMLPEISKKFGLAHDDVEKLDPQQANKVYIYATSVGNMIIGRPITQKLIIALLQRMGVKVATKSVARFVPFIGQAIGATVSFGMMKRAGDRHIDDCYQTAKRLLEPQKPPTTDRDPPEADPRPA